jgi:lipoate---protein ligase
MKFFDLSGSSAIENLAIDESLLEAVETGQADQTLRVWEALDFFVVLGCSCRAQDDVRLDYCRRHQIPVLKRISGGGTVLQGPGCLNYSLVLKIRSREDLSSIHSTNAFIMQKHRAMIEAITGKTVRIMGHTDLAIDDRKFSGNSQRRKKNALLFHGVFLLDFNLEMIERCLTIPLRQPAYRQNRPHRDFLMNLGLTSDKLTEGLRDCWLKT